MGSPRRRLLAALIAAAAVAAACGDEDRARFTSPKATIVDGVSVLPLPDGAERVEITVTDYETAAAAMGVEPLPDDATAVDADDWINQLFGDRLALRPPRIIDTGRLADPEVFVGEFGWSFYDIGDSAEIIVDGDPATSQFAVLRGEVTWVNQVELGDGVGSIGEGLDGEPNRDDRSEVRPLGVPVRTGARDNLIAAGRSTEQVAQWIANDFESAATDSALLSAAERLDAVGAYSARIKRSDFSAAAAQLETEPTVDPIDEEFDVVALGVSGEFSELTATVVYVFDDDGPAKGASSQIEERWRGLDVSQLNGTFRITTLEQRGDAVVVIGRVDNGRLANEVFDLAASNGLFLHD